MKWRRSILTLILYIQNGWRSCFHDKRRRAYFHDERQNGRHVRFHHKSRCDPRNTHLLHLHNQRRAIGTRVSLLSQKQARLIFLDRRRSHLSASSICVSNLSFLRSDDSDVNRAGDLLEQGAMNFKNMINTNMREWTRVFALHETLQFAMPALSSIYVPTSSHYNKNLL
jgi:hypothetical protein